MSYDLDNYLTGEKLRSFRLEANMTLAQAAESVGVSPAFISMVESGKSGITFAKVHALLDLYGKDLFDLSVSTDADAEIISISNAGLVASEPGVRILGLARAGDVLPYNIGGFYLYYEPGAKNQFDYHPGAEFLVVIEGTFELRFHTVKNGKDVYSTRTLSAGDTIVYSSAVGHEYKNIGDSIGRLLIVEVNDKSSPLVL